MLKSEKKRDKNTPDGKSRDFCLVFMNNVVDMRRNQGSRPWIFKTQENPGSRPWTFDDYEFHLRNAVEL